MMVKNVSYSFIGIAGQIGAGKTSLARKLSQRLGSETVSFGSFVKSQALSRNVPINRNALQDLGEQLIKELGVEHFVEQSLALERFPEHALLILDGIRHIEIWEAIKTRAETKLLVYLDIPEAERLKRVLEREQSEEAEVLSQFHHPMELNATRLKPLADIVWSQLEIAPLTDLVVRKLQSANGDSTCDSD
jgi:cytidylate kinase